MPARTPALSLERLSTHLADLVDRVAPSVVAVHGRGRGSSSGIVWRPGLIVTAEEALEADEDISVSRPDGTEVGATLVGRDPSRHHPYPKEPP